MSMQLNDKYWNNRYENLETGWDVGKVSIPLKEYFEQIIDKKKKILIPGSGNGYEGEYLFKNNFRNTHILEYSSKAVRNFIKRVPSFPKNQIHNIDFFSFEGKFNLIIEQTFFCALDIKLRNDYVKKVSSLLVKGGKLVGLLFDIPLNTAHPPFGGDVNEYLQLFSETFKVEVLERCYNSISSRRGKELFVILVKK